MFYSSCDRMEGYLLYDKSSLYHFCISTDMFSQLIEKKKEKY